MKTWVEAHALGVGSAGLVALLVGGGVGVAGLTSGDPEATPAVDTVQTAETTTSTTPAPSEPTSTDQPASTGDGSVMIAVRVDNAPEARPQIGLSRAPLIIEAPVEGGLTRFTAFYPAGTDLQLVGPVRSVRPVDPALVTPFATTMVSTGGQPFVLQAFDGAAVAMAMPETAPGFTALERPSPHNLFVRLSEIESVYPPQAVDEPGFGEGEFPSGRPAATITVPLPSEVRWEHGAGGYARFEADEPFEVLDQFDGDVSQLSVDSVVILFAAERSAGYTDSNDADVPTFDVIGAGRLLVFNGGEVVEGTWSRAAQEDPYRFSSSDGEALAIPDGRTHMMVVPRELEVQY